MAMAIGGHHMPLIVLVFINCMLLKQKWDALTRVHFEGQPYIASEFLCAPRVYALKGIRKV